MRKLLTLLLAIPTLFVGITAPADPALAVNYDCHYFRGYDGRGHYQGRSLCFALPHSLYQLAKMTCITSTGGQTVTLYGDPAADGQLSQTGWHSGICSVGSVYV